MVAYYRQGRNCGGRIINRVAIVGVVLSTGSQLWGSYYRQGRNCGGRIIDRVAIVGVVLSTGSQLWG